MRLLSLPAHVCRADETEAAAAVEAPPTKPETPETPSPAPPVEEKADESPDGAGEENTDATPGSVTPSGQPKSPPVATPVAQMNGSTVQMPAPNKLAASRMSGYFLKVDARWTNTYGYRPVEVSVHSLKPTKTSHVITVQLHTGWNRSMAVEKSFEFPKGSTSASTTISVPNYETSLNDSFRWDVWVDGVRDKDMSAEQMSAYSWMGNSGGNASLSFLVVGDSTNNRSLVSTNAMEFQALSLEMAKFPTQWIDYTSFDVIALSYGEMKKLQTKQPAAFEAIERWVRSGGQLWICDVGAKYDDLPAISKLFHLSEAVETLSEPAETSPEKTGEAKKTDAAENTSDVNKNIEDAKTNKSGKAEKPPERVAVANKTLAVGGDKTPPKEGDKAAEPSEVHVPTGWHPLRFRRGTAPEGQVVTFLDTRTGVRRTVRDPEVIARLQQDPNQIAAEERTEEVPTVRTKRTATDSSEWYVEQNMGLGSIRAFLGANEVSKFAKLPSTQNLNAATNSNAPDQFAQPLAMGLRRTERWDSRHGMTPDGANAEFFKLLLPNVGRAPVTEFEILITVFVLVIGPLNYWILKRNRRLHLMVLTVPLAAVVTTVALFAYAVVADGFASRVRAYSYTKLDQRLGEAACWSRLSYYSGLSPSGGLSMKADMAIYPIQPGWSDDDSYENRKLTWQPEQEILASGWLNSRTPTQYLTVRARKSPHQIAVSDGGDKLRIRNELGTTIKTLFVIGESAQVFRGEKIAAGESMSLAPIAREAAVRELGHIVTDTMPRAPEELGGDADTIVNSGRGRFRRYTRFGANQANTGRLSDNLAGDAIVTLAGLAGSAGLDLPPRSYVAITEKGPEVETGIADALEEVSFHLIEGRW